MKPYPGTMQPVWWTSAGNVTTTTTGWWPSQPPAETAPSRKPEPKPETAVDWLRRRVSEITELAPAL